MNTLQTYKARYLKSLLSISSFQSAYPIWKPYISGLLGSNPTGSDVFDLADHLNAIFRLTGVGGRGQGTVSQAGTVWESLVCWYLNIVFWDTNVCVARKGKAHVPDVVADAISVTILNNKTNTESDIVVFSVPEADDLAGSKLKDLNSHLKARIGDASLHVIQCKTNWNENAQIPMLWDLIYNSQKFKVPYVSVGVNGVNPASFGDFSYAFMTVPSNSNVTYTPTGLPVLRVAGLTGGNYWGRQSAPGVAASLKEFAGRKFPAVFPGGVPAHLNNAIAASPSDYAKFFDFTW